MKLEPAMYQLASQELGTADVPGPGLQVRAIGNAAMILRPEFLKGSAVLTMIVSSRESDSGES